MSHELRTPLNAIGGYAELLEMGVRGPVNDAQRLDLGRIQHSQRHLLGLINEVLNYARVEGGAVRYATADVSVASVLASVEPLVRPQLEAKGLTLRALPAPRGLAVHADEDKVRQILLNLLSNAVKFTDRGGCVTLETIDDPEAGRVRFRVVDTGIGIPPDKLDVIFDPFVQVNASLTRTQEGAGLGLAISRDLARGMGGELTVESAPGQGSTFTLSLPPAIG
jgi:signal transduction histidine kinase